MNRPFLRRRRSLRPDLLLAILALAAVTMTGCTADPQLTLTSLDHQQTYRQQFSQACASRDANGELDVVLLDKACQQEFDGQPTNCPVHQLMHVRMAWSPTRDAKPNAANAAVQWYVIGKSGAVLQYSGVAFVSASDDGQTTTLHISNAVLRPVPTPAGAVLHDPVGSSSLEGSVVAQMDSARVSQALAAIRAVHSSSPIASPPPAELSSGGQ